jgi:hypothetical protein
MPSRSLSLAALLLAGASRAALGLDAAGAAAYRLIFTDAHGNDPPSSARANVQCGGDGTMPFWIQQAGFDAAGSRLTAPADASTELCGAGYLSLSANRSTLIFASMDLSTPGNIGNVASYSLALGASGAAPVAPTRIFNDVSALLAACGAEGPCLTVSTFHATFAPDDAKIFFAYRAWNSDEDGIGNQAIATADADGSGVKPLTFTTAGSYKGINIIDACPAPSRADPSKVFFLRSLDQGMSMFAAVAELASGEVTLLDALPEYAISSGCPNFVETADGVSILYMGCVSGVANCSFSEGLTSVDASKRDRRAAWGLGNAMVVQDGGLAAGSASFYDYGVVRVKGPLDALNFTSRFNVPLTNTPDTVGSYAITQCDQIHGRADSDLITCQGADPTHSFTQLVLVDSMTGANASAISFDTFRACMTPRCSLLAVA